MYWLIVILLFLIHASAHAQDRYRVSFGNGLDEVTVEACFDGQPPHYLYSNADARRHTEWIRSGGQEIKPRYRQGRVRLPDLPEDACIQWRVSLASVLQLRDYRLAILLEDTLVGSGDLWFWRDAERRPLRVEVELPSGVSFSVPWEEQTSSSGRVFIPEPTPPSWSWRFAVGRFDARKLRIADSEIRLALTGRIKSAKRSALADWIRENAESVASIYGRFPRDQAQVLVVGIGPQNEAVPWAHVIRGGGVAAEFFIDASRPLDEFRDDWTAAHEFSHMLLPHISSRDRWLSEGLASYYQNVLRARDGRLTEQEAWRKLHSGFERGRRATRNESLAKATRSDWGATMRIYWSGAAMMLKADTRLRALTGGRQSLDTALSGLQRCCLDGSRGWRAKELFARLDQLTGQNVFMDLYANHVTDDDFPELDAIYDQLGLVFRSGSLVLDPEAPWGRIRYYIMNDPAVSGP